MNRINLPANILKELAIKRLEQRKKLIEFLDLQPCIDSIKNNISNAKITIKKK